MVAVEDNGNDNEAEEDEEEAAEELERGGETNSKKKAPDGWEAEFKVDAVDLNGEPTVEKMLAITV